MARWLLFWAFAVLSSLTYTGCIIPVPLQAQTDPPNSRPNIVVGESTPPAGQITRQSNDVIEFVVRVDDADVGPDDFLYARLMLGDAMNRTTLDSLDRLPSAGDADNPARRIASFNPRKYCAGFQKNVPLTISVIVSDAPFKDATSPDTDGATDEVGWVLTCN